MSENASMVAMGGVAWGAVLVLLGLLVALPVALPSARPPPEAAPRLPLRSGIRDNEALPPMDEIEKEQEKKLRAFEKWKSLKGPPSSSSDAKKLQFEVEKFFVEHEISEKSAKKEAKKLNLSQLADTAGCEECTQKEMEYCAGVQVMNDHCCCDNPDEEVFPYIPHTCYLGANTPCVRVANDCEEYKRLRVCCCDKHLATKWKRYLSNASEKIEVKRKLWILPWTLAFLINFQKVFLCS